MKLVQELKAKTNATYKAVEETLRHDFAHLAATGNREIVDRVVALCSGLAQAAYKAIDDMGATGSDYSKDS